MPGKIYTVRNAFNSGEVGELVNFRDDIAKYSSACLTLENSVPLVEGGAKKMPGTYFAGTTALGGSVFTASIAGTTLTVTAVELGVLQLGQTVLGAGVAAGTVIIGSGSTTDTGSVTDLGREFIEPVFTDDTPPDIAISISGDGSGASAYISWVSRPAKYPFALWTPTLHLTGGTGYTAASATVTITNGIGVYPDGTHSYTCVITFTPSGGGGGGTGTGGVGTYTVNNSQTVASETMMTPTSGKSRLVPFQFSTIQGAFIELSQGIARIWEGASQGSWSLGLALDLATSSNYNPATAYVLNNLAVFGPYCRIYKYGDLAIGGMFVCAPYGTSNANTVPITVTTNGSDALSVTITGSSPNQGINIALADSTAANNAASAVQAAIRALTSLNSPSSNFVDLSAWTVTPDSVYYATPWIVAPGYPPMASYFGWENHSQIVQCTQANQHDEFPIDLTTLSYNSAYWVQYFPPPEMPIELVTPYAEADLFDLDCSTQSADVLWIFHHKYPPACIERLSANSWSYSLSLPGQQTGEPPYRGTTDVVKTGYSALGQSITAITQANPCVVSVSATSEVFSAGDRIYTNLIGGMVELNQGEFLVTSPSSGSGVCSFGLEDPDTGAAVDSSNYLQYVSGGFVVKVVPMFAVAGDYPACGTLYQERLTVGGSDNNPTQLNGSVQDDYPDFICDPNADDYAIQFTLVSNKLDQILSMIGTPNALLIGSAGGVWVMAGSNGSSLSQTNVDASKQSSIGVGTLQPQLVNDAAIFVSRSSRMVMFLVFNFATNEWEPYDLTRLNRNITLGNSPATSGIAQTAFQSEPYPIYWAVRNDGQLIGLVFNKQDQVMAWFRVNMMAEGGIIESCAVISGQNQEDQLAIVVNRTINGVPFRYVEYFMPQELFGQLSNAFFVHCGQQWQGLGPVSITGITRANPPVVTADGHGFTTGFNVQIQNVQGMTEINQDATEAYTITVIDANTFSLDGMNTTGFGAYTGGGTAAQVTNQVTGMSYLLGQNVTAVGDGALILQPTPVTSDTVTFPYFANLITIGIPYETTIQPTNPVLTTQGATTRGMKQKLSRVTLSLYQSMGGQFGSDLAHMYDITYGQGTQGKPPSMSSLELTRDMDDDWSDESTFYVTQSDPFPFTLRGIVFRMSANQD